MRPRCRPSACSASASAASGSSRPSASCSCRSRRARARRGGRRSSRCATTYKQKPPALREAEERGLPIFVLKSNTLMQMQACADVALRARGRSARSGAARGRGGHRPGHARRKPVELSPQNAYIRRLQHQMAERANLVSHSRGREPYRRVRLYPDRSAPGASGQRGPAARSIRRRAAVLSRQRAAGRLRR